MNQSNHEITLKPQWFAHLPALLANVGWIRDSRDSAITPTRGRAQSANLEVAIPPAELRYWRANYNHQWYYPLNRDYTLALYGDVAYGRAYGDKPYPLFKNYFAGGIGSVRGFYPSSLGPKDTETLIRGGTREVPLGGQMRVIGSAEFIFPLPGTGNDRTIRSFVFFDVGNVFEEGDFDAGELRYSTGLGLNWLSPVGPLKLSIGFPINKKDGDRTQRVQFQIGTGF